MYKYSEASLAHLNTCRSELQTILNEIIKIMDIKITCGYRDEEGQNEELRKGTSQLKFPYSKHNKKPSNAVDIEPWPLDYKIIHKFFLFKFTNKIIFI